MVRYKGLFYCVAIMTASFALSCSDNNDDPDPDPNPDFEDCRVVTYRCESRNETWRIVYNESGSYDSILIGDQQNVDMIRAFEYSNAPSSDLVTVTVDRFYLGEPAEGPSYVEISGTTGKIFSIRDERYDVEDSWEAVSFGYRIDQPALVDKSAESMYGSDETYESFYQWEVLAPDPAINMTKLATPSGVYTYNYYNQLTQPGDYLNFEKVIGAYDKYYRPFSSSHLLKSIELDGEPIVEITYTFDSEGKITSFTADYDGGAPEKWDLTYECE